MKDLKNLNREEKLILIEAAKEKKRRLRKTRPPYVPNSGQLQIHQCSKRVRLVTAGNGSGKSSSAVNEVIWALKGYNPILDVHYRVPARVIVVLDRPSKVADVWIPELEKWEDISSWEPKKLGHPHIEEYWLPNGSVLKFMFHNSNILSFESIEAQNLVVYDEPCQRFIWVALQRAARTKKYETKHLMIATPLGANWTRQFIWTPWSKGELPDTECMRFGTEVNRANLAEGYIEKFSSILTEQEKRVRLEGLYEDMEGLALAHLFKRETHVILKKDFIWNPDWAVVVAIDYHPSKDNVACMLGVDRDGYYYYIKEFSSSAAPQEYTRELRAWMEGYRVKDIVCDSLGASPTSGGEGNMSFIDVLKKYGVRVRSTQFKEKNDEDFMTRIQNVLELPLEPNKVGQRIPKLRFLEGNKGVITDIENVAWAKYRNMEMHKPHLEISNKDFLATLKYALAANPMPGGIKTRPLRSDRPSPWSGKPR